MNFDLSTLDFSGAFGELQESHSVVEEALQNAADIKTVSDLQEAEIAVREFAGELNEFCSCFESLKEAFEKAAESIHETAEEAVA